MSQAGYNGYRGIDMGSLGASEQSHLTEGYSLAPNGRNNNTKIGFGAASTSPYLGGIAGDMASQYAAAGGRAAPTMSAVGTGPASMVDPTKIAMGEDSADAAGQAAFMRALAARAAGYGPSAGSQALWQGYGSTMAGNLAALQSGPQTGPAGAALRGYADTAATGAQQTGAEAAMVREQERQAAMAQLGGLASSYRGSALGMANAQAGLDADAKYNNASAANQFGLANAGFAQQAGQQNLGAYLAQTGMNDSMRQAMFGGQAGIADFNRNAWLTSDADTNQFAQGVTQANQQQSQADLSMGMKMASAVGSMFASDKRLKKEIEPADRKLERFLAGIGY